MFSETYINNGIHAVVVRPPIPATQLGTQPLADTALALRHALENLKRDTPTLLAELAEQATHPDRTLFPARPGEEWAIATNWLRAQFLDLEFVDAEKRIVRPTWFCAFRQDKIALPLRGTGSIRCEDEDAVWAAWTMAKKDFSALRKTGLIQFCEY